MHGTAARSGRKCPGPMQRDKILKELCGNAADLVLNHGMRHEEILEAVRDELLTKAEELPKVPVIYNGCYGGFGYSTEVKQFRKGRHMTAYQSIVNFGQSLRELFPCIYSVLYLVSHLELKKRIEHLLCELIDTKRDLAWLQLQLHHLDSAEGFGYVDTVPAKQFHQSKAKQSSFDIDALSLACRSELSSFLTR